MALTFAQMEEDEISRANSISAEDALRALDDDPAALVVDVRDTAEVDSTGISPRAIPAPGRAIAWMADLESEYKSQDLQDRTRRIFTTCGGAPSYRGAAAANTLTSMGFEKVQFIDGGMAAMVAAGSPIKIP